MPAVEDLLWTARYGMVGLSLLAQDILGTSTQITGAPCTPTSPASLAVLIGAGRIYSMAALEPSAWSSLAADATQILKQGTITSAGITLSTPAPTTSGQSINYLIEGQYQEVDSANQTIVYYNAANPSQPFSGPGNSGTAQPTIRSGVFAVQAKAGTAATTGTQTTPAADSGWVPMYVVTVAQGQTTVVSGNISAAPNAIAQTGSFTLTGVGFSGTAPTCVCGYKITSGFATIAMGPGMSGTSNSTSFSATGLPSFLNPNAFANNVSAVVQLPLATAENNTAAVSGFANFPWNSGTILFGTGTVGLTGWTASGTKAAGGTFSYPL